MPAVLGLRGTGDWGTDERPKNFEESILWKYPNGSTPLLAMTSRMGSEKVDDPEFSWWEQTLDATRVALAAAALVGDTTLNVGSGANALSPGDLLLVQTAETLAYNNEVLQVSVVNSDASVSVVRARAGTTATAIPINTGLLKIGSSFAEGTGAPNSSTTTPDKRFNYTQIFKTAYEITATGDVTKARTGPLLANAKKTRMHDHAVALELAYLFGKRSEVIGSNGKPQRTMNGIRSMLSSNLTIFGTGSTNMSGTVPWNADNFLSAVAPVFNYTSDSGSERLALVGNDALTAINKLVAASNGVRFTTGETLKVYGMELQKYVLPQGTLLLKTHPLMNNNPSYRRSMFILDPSFINKVILRDTKFQDNIQATDSDTIKGQWIGEVSLKLKAQETMAYLGNLG